MNARLAKLPRKSTDPPKPVDLALDFRSARCFTSRVAAGLTLLCSLLCQQLLVSPYPAEVGSPVTITAVGRHGEASVPLAALPLSVQLPDGSVQTLQPTDADGKASFVPTQPGSHVYQAEVAGVRVLAPHAVVARRNRMLLWSSALPLGVIALYLLWRLRSWLLRA